MLLAAELVLKRRFGTVVTACTPASIELLLSQHSFDVILLDMNFTTGATSGDEGIHWLKTSLRLAPDSKVVLMTAYGGVDEAVRAMREGATGLRGETLGQRQAGGDGALRLRSWPRPAARSANCAAVRAR